jgi:hypothetical protein
MVDSFVFSNRKSVFLFLFYPSPTPRTSNDCVLMYWCVVNDRACVLGELCWTEEKNSKFPWIRFQHKKIAMKRAQIRFPDS